MLAELPNVAWAANRRSSLQWLGPVSVGAFDKLRHRDQMLKLDRQHLGSFLERLILFLKKNDIQDICKRVFPGRAEKGVVSGCMPACCGGEDDISFIG